MTTTEDHPPPAAAPPAAPRWRPSPIELDDLSMVLLGAYRGVDGFGADTGPPAAGRAPTLVLPTGPARDAGAHGSLVLLDEESVPVALVAVDRVADLDGARCLVAGRVTGLGAAPRGTHATFRVPVPVPDRPPGGPGTRHPVLAVPVDRPVHLPLLVQIRTLAERLGARVLLLPLTGHGRARGVDGPALVRACLAVRTLIDAQVIPIGVPRRTRTVVDDPVSELADDALVRRVAVAYGATEVVRPGVRQPDGRPAVGAELPEVALDLRTGLWAPSEDVGPSHRSELTLADVEAHLEAITDRRVPAEPGLFDAVMERELRRTRPGGRLGFAVFFTGLSGSGKSTIAQALRERILERSDRTVTLLDGDVVRTVLSSELGFHREHRVLNVRRIGFVAAQITGHGGIALCAPIAPYDETRREVRDMVESTGAGFVLVHVATPLTVCESRDRKGLYVGARAGRIPEFTGISDPYEAPTDAEVVADTSAEDAEAVVERILAIAAARGWVELDPVHGTGSD